MSEDPTDRSGPGRGVRSAIFAGVVVVIAVTVAYVVRADIDRRADDGSAAASTVVTYVAPPAPGGDDPVPTAGSTVPLPSAGPVSGSAFAIELEKVVRTETGWTHKVWCEPSDVVTVGDVLGCSAETEPPIDFQPPSQIVAVVIDADRAIYVRGRTAPYSVEALVGAEGLTCADLIGQDYPYVSALAWWLLHDRPPALLEAGETDRPCVVTYGSEAVDAAFATTVEVPGD